MHYSQCDHLSAMRLNVLTRAVSKYAGKKCGVSFLSLAALLAWGFTIFFWADAGVKNYQPLIFSALMIVLFIYIDIRLSRSQKTNDRLSSALKESEENLVQKTKALRQAQHDFDELNLQFIQNDKMSSLGQQLAGVAHDLNTPLAYLRGNLEVVNHHLEELANHGTASGESNRCDEMRGLIKDGIYGAKQVSEIVASLNNFSRSNPCGENYFDLHQAIDGALTIAHHAVKDHAEIRKNVCDLPKIAGSSSAVSQVILNLVINASQAMVGKGLIEITTSRIDEDTIALEVKDNGRGISPDIQGKIFDPFFTTREAGNGLGLSVVRRIVDAHGGAISVVSEEGEGARFKIFLPINHRNKEQGVRKIEALKVA